jgi:hypothetical protein
MPILSGIGAADIGTIFLDVGKDTNFLIRLRNINRSDWIPLDLAEQFRKTFDIADIQPLIRKAQHAVFTEREKDTPEIGLTQRLGKIDSTNGGAQDRARRFNGQHRTVLSSSAMHLQRSGQTHRHGQ